MGLVIKIAWRNLWRHRGKSLVIGTILFLGALIMTIGNGVISGMDRGLQEHIVDGFTGDIIIVSENQESDNLFLDFLGKAIAPIHNFPEIEAAIGELPYVNRFMPVGKNMAMVLNEDGGNPGFCYVIGVDFERYRKMFHDNCQATEGRLLEPGEAGVLVAGESRNQFYDYTNIWFIAEDDSLRVESLPKDRPAHLENLSVKNNVVFMGFNNQNTTTDIRLGIKGVIKYKALNKIWGHFVLMDIESYRQCLGYFATSDMTTELSGTQEALLGMDNEGLDDLFGNSDLFSSETTREVPGSSPDAEKQIPVTTSVAPDLDRGTYNLVLVVLNDGMSSKEGAIKVNAVLKEAGVGARAVSWRKATGMIGSTSVIIKAALFVFVLLLFFVAVIIIVNTLTMTALERTPEIGMMRAIGARKGFISSMFFGETAVISFFFGGAGIVTGIAAVNILTMLNITTDNDMVQLLYGGDTFRPLLAPEDVILAVVQLLIVTLLAVLYPMKVARGITPLDAISRE